MRSPLNKIFQGFIVFTGLSLAASAAQAGGAFSTTPGGEPVLWQGPVIWRAESGPIKGNTAADGGDTGGGGGGGGCALTKNIEVNNTDAVQIVRDAFAAWDNVPNASIDIQEGPSLGVDVNFDNIENFWVGSFFGGSTPSNVTAAGCYDADPNTECLNSVIFDSSNVPERSIVDAIQGQCARFSILAFAAILPQQNNDAQGTITSPILKSSQMVISGACLQPVIAPDPNCDNPGTSDNEGACPAGGITLDELKGTVVHEVGHYLGLDHTAGDADDYINCQTGGACDLERIPTMIGLFVPGANLNTLTYEDQVTFSRYYPGPTFSNTCEIKGSAFNNSGSDDARCMNVVAVKEGEPSKVATFIAGSEAKRRTQGIPGAEGINGKNQSNCDGTLAQCGAYSIRGLEPGNYTMFLQNFSDNGKGSGLSSFVLEPCTPPLTAANFGDTKGVAGLQVTGVTCTAGVPKTQDLNSAN